MGSAETDGLPPVDAIDPGVFGDLQRLVLWQCKVGDRQRPVRVGQPLIAAFEGCGYLLDGLGVGPAEALHQLDEVLPRTPGNEPGTASQLYAVRAMLGLLDSPPTYETYLLGAEEVRLGDADAHPGTVESRRFTWDKNIEMRKAFVVRLFGATSPSAVKVGSPAAFQMVRALAGALQLTGGRSRPYEGTAPRPHALFSQQLAQRVNEPAAAYPRHLTPDVLVESLTLSAFAPPRAGQPDGTKQELYTGVRSQGGEPALDVVRRERRLVVLGNPGGGKSTVLSASVVSVARTGAPVVFVRLPSFIARGQTPHTSQALLDSLLEIQSEDLGIPLATDCAELSRALAADANALIALDGLDEVHPNDVERVHNLLRLLADTPGQVMVSSRLAGYATPPGQWQEFTVDALTPVDAERFLSAWFPDAGEGVTRARAALETTSGKALAETPVLLGIIATVAEEEDVPLAVPQLYDHYVSHYLRGKWRHRSQWLPVARIPEHLRTAQLAAWMMATGMTGDPGGVRWSDTITYRALVDIDHTYESDVATTLVEQHGLLVPHGRHRSELHQQYRWLHRTVHEHLVGGYLAAIVRSRVSVPDELLMGPTQWDLPLRHMLGLLNDDEARRVFQQAAALQAMGDPGGVIENLTQRIAVGLPPDSSLLSERAQAMAAVGAWYSAVELDPTIINSEYVAAIERRDEHAITLQSYALRAYLPEAGVARRLVAALSGVRLQCDDHLRGHVDGALEQAVSWLSYEDADGALAALVDAATARYIDPPYLQWLGSEPTRTDASRAIEVVATWEPQYRLRHLDFLAEIGVDLEQYVQPDGPLLARDVRVALALWRARRGRDASDPSPYPLPDDVIALILTGAYGDDAAYDMAVRDDLADRNKNATGLGAALARQVAALYQVEADSGPDANPTGSATRLAQLTLADIRNAENLPSVLDDARTCVENASLVPIGLALAIHWNLALLDGAPASRPFKPSLHWPFNAARDATMKIFAARAAETIAAILESDPAQWVTRPPAWADYSAVYALDNAGGLDLDDLHALTRWAASAGGQMLRYVTREAMTEEFTTKLYAKSPESVRINLLEVADALARLGRLAEWRTRLIALTSLS